ncbi:MAG: hypothetical protein NWE84_00820 [Candidatus Bathyarchaeota archaeon]|nr:hypothetical protein [Candidatus Bathyarchaeota archaeon]
MELVVYAVWKDKTDLGYITSQGVNAEPYAIQWNIISPNEIQLVKQNVWNNIGPIRIRAWMITPP